MVFNPCLMWGDLFYHKTTNMKYNEFAAFIVGIALAVIAAVLYGWSENTSDGNLGRILEGWSIGLFLVGVGCLVSMFIFGNKPK